MQSTAQVSQGQVSQGRARRLPRAGGFTAAAVVLAISGCEAAPDGPGFAGDPGAFEARPVPAAGTRPTAGSAPEWVVRVAGGARTLSRFAVAGDYLYFAAKDAGLYRTRKTGGPIEVVEAGSDTTYNEVAAAGDQVYWLRTHFAGADRPRVTVRFQRAGDGTAATRLETDWGTLWSNTALHFQADAGGVYMNVMPGGGHAGGIVNLPAAGGTPIEMLPVPDVAHAPVWVIDQSYLYFSSCPEPDSCQLARVSKSGGETQLLALIPVAYAAVRAVDATDLYLTSPNAIWKVDKVTGERQILPIPGTTVSPHLALDDLSLIFLENRDRTHRLRAVLKSGQGAATLVMAQFPNGIHQMAHDADNVYLLHGRDEIVAWPKLPPPPR